MAGMGENIKGRGILYVNSRILPSSPLNEPQFLKWYSQDHIPEIIATSGVNSAFRFKSPDLEAERPYLAIYPMEDISFTQADEFKKISVHSELLPDNGPIYDLADFDTRYYGLLQYYAPSGDPKPGDTKMLVTAGFEFENKHLEEDFDDWYRKEHLEQVSKVPGYLRTTRYKLLYHRNNAVSRLMKGLPPRPEDHGMTDPPTNLAIHEFSTLELDIPALMKTADTELSVTKNTADDKFIQWSKAVMGRSLKTETPMFRFEESFGDGKFFD